jgi:hypothetical protein
LSFVGGVGLADFCCASSGLEAELRRDERFERGARERVLRFLTGDSPTNLQEQNYKNLIEFKKIKELINKCTNKELSIESCITELT